MKYEIVIGLEIHVQAKTKSKMFCRCDAKYFNTEPNSHVCPVCIGLPGALPVPNKVAIDKCVKLGLALNCSINKFSKFDRKNYFYPDLPKGYQISQYDLPFCYEGFLEIDIDGDSRRIRITRIHMEEDTGKSMHEGNETLLDFNKSGVPLVEIVTEPDFKDIKEVNLFAKRLKQIVKYLDISDADMEKGQMRFELNMSLRESGKTGLPNYKVEVKNIGSISVLEKVIEFEYKRQSELLDKGETPAQETRGLRDLTGVTYSQRKKEEANDYRYFPEPDIPPIIYTEEELAEIKGQIIELPHEKIARYERDYKMEKNLSETVVSTINKAKWFELAVKSLEDKSYASEIAKWFVGDLSALIKANKDKLSSIKIQPAHLAELMTLLKTGKVSGSIAKQVLAEMYTTGNLASEIIKSKGLETVDDESLIIEIAKKVIEQNSKVVADIEKNPNAIKFLLGQVMRETKGKADPKIAESILSKLLDKK
jgi:aspartyl-tRNA(Asn)/glutamyl-tRNA(Gln) amidotransferase subunit B